MHNFKGSWVFMGSCGRVRVGVRVGVGLEVGVRVKVGVMVRVRVVF